MPNENNSIDQTFKDEIAFLQTIQSDLEEFFTLTRINYKIKLDAIKIIPETNIVNENSKLDDLLKRVRAATEEISSKTIYTNYREFGEVITEVLLLFKTLQSLLPSNPSKFRQESYRLLKCYWAIRYVIARFKLESIPEYYANQLLFFNFPDAILEFIEHLKGGPQPIEILAEVDLEIRLHKGLPLLVSRSPDEITLSLLGEKFLNVHSISELYFYYLYDFEEEVLGIK